MVDSENTKERNMLYSNQNFHLHCREKLQLSDRIISLIGCYEKPSGSNPFYKILSTI
jgi:hypothetical protein